MASQERVRATMRRQPEAHFSCAPLMNFQSEEQRWGKRRQFPCGPSDRALLVYRGGKRGVDQSGQTGLGNFSDPDVTGRVGREGEGFHRTGTPPSGELHVEPWLLSATPKVRYPVHERGEAYSETPVQTLLRQWDGCIVLIVVNGEDAALDLRVDLPVRLRARDARPVLGQREGFRTVRGRIYDLLAPLGGRRVRGCLHNPFAPRLPRRADGGAPSQPAKEVLRCSSFWSSPHCPGHLRSTRLIS